MSLFFCLVRVRLVLSSMAVLYHADDKLQTAHCYQRDNFNDDYLARLTSDQTISNALLV